MKVIIDRFDGNYAVVELENRIMVNIPIEIIPKGSREGDVLEIKINKTETEKRKNKNAQLLNDLIK